MSTSRFRRSGIYVRFWKGDTQLNNAYAAANDDCLEWQFLSGSIEATKAYDRVEVMLVYNYNANSAIFYGAQLFKEEFAYRYTYDSSGRVTKVTDLEGRATSYTYRSGSSDITKITLPGGAEYNYSYNNSNLLSGTTSAEGVKTTHSYDSYGNATQTKITYANNSGPVIQSNQTYTTDGNFQTTATTGDRNTVTYNYDTERATLTSVTDALSTTTTNAYDIMRRLTSTTTGGASVSYAYDGADRLSSITHTGATPTTYSFAYTTAGLTDTVRIGERVLSDNTYNSGTWTLASQTYGNGQSWNYEYNVFDELTRRYSGNTEFRYFYNNEGALARVEQYNAGTLTAVERWYYDTGDRPTRVVELDGSGNVTHSYGWTYDHNDNVTALTESVNGQTYTYSYTYNSDQQPTSMGGTISKDYTYDNYGRLSGSSGGPLGVGYTYRDIDTTYTTTQVATITNTYAGTAHSLSYTYDANGNILSVSDGTNTTSYVYDTLGQLTRENNQAAGKTWTWTYDTGGNILSRSEYAYTTGELGTATDTVSYTYGDTSWGDLLTAYDGAAITYDGVGNMTAYDGWTFSWQGGRQLAGMSNGTTALSFDYNEAGLRTKKSDGTTTHKYIYRGEQLIADIAGDDALYFRYDQNGDVLGFYRKLGVNEANYTYVKNMQGDVIAALDHTGAEAATYTYDAWGNILSIGGYDSNLANRNPLRYRGYMYDSETGLYYVSSRYYDPEIGRWISPEPNVYNGEFDEGAGLIGYNVYAYCANNPVNNIDPTGEFVISTAVLIGIGIGALIGGTAGGVYGYKKAVKNNVAKQDRWKYVVGYGLGGAVVGGVIGGFVGYGAGVALGAKASSGLVVKSISKALSSVSRNTMYHIMQSKHAWGQVLKRATWNNVKSLINTTMQKGATTLINKQGNALIYEAVRNNIVVRYAVIDGIIKISDAWVKTR